MSAPATSPTIQLPKIVVYLHRRHDRTITTSYTGSIPLMTPWQPNLLRSQRIRSLDEAKQRINRRLAPFTTNVEYVDPPGEAAAAVLGKG